MATICLAGACAAPAFVPLEPAALRLDGSNPLAPSAANQQAGFRVWSAECASCHGRNGHGKGPAAADLNVPPGNLTSADTQALSDAEIFRIVSEGDRPMPSFAKRLSETERWQAILYVRVLAARS